MATPLTTPGARSARLALLTHALALLAASPKFKELPEVAMPKDLEMELTATPPLVEVLRLPRAPMRLLPARAPEIKTQRFQRRSGTRRGR